MAEPRDGEHDRLARVFGEYRDDPGRRNAWDAANPGNRAIRRELTRATLAVLAGHDPGGLLLDAGCGTGWWPARLLDIGVEPERVVGVDLLEDRVQAASQRAPAATIVAGDIRALPIDDSSCALVTLFTVLSGMASAAEVDIALAEAWRVLAPGGAIVVWEPRVPTPNRDTRLIRLSPLRRSLGPRVSSRSITVAPPLARRAGPVYRLLAAVPPLRSHRLVVARKP
jgi:ubiquinone/menaquinone biosynthesis C-methylase UbiE